MITKQALHDVNFSTALIILVQLLCSSIKWLSHKIDDNQTSSSRYKLFYSSNNPDPIPILLCSSTSTKITTTQNWRCKLFHSSWYFLHLLSIQTNHKLTNDTPLKPSCKHVPYTFGTKATKETNGAQWQIGRWDWKHVFRWQPSFVGQPVTYTPLC